MNILEKLKNYLADENRSIVFGKPQTADTDVLSLSMGDSDDAELSLGDDGCIMYQTLNVTVYAEDYLQGYDLLMAVRSEITSAEKNSVKIAFLRFCESDYDAALEKHVLKSRYKIFE